MDSQHRMNTDKKVHTASNLLGPSPVWRGLAFWLSGVLYCFVAWHVHAASPMIGLGLMGMSPMVTMYCFFNGLSRLKRSWLYWRTIKTATRLALDPVWGSGLAGFFLVDEKRGICVANGKSLDFSHVTELECRSTHMAHRLFIRAEAGAGTAPLEIGFGSEQALHVAALRFHSILSARNPGTTIDITHTQP